MAGMAGLATRTASSVVPELSQRPARFRRALAENQPAQFRKSVAGKLQGSVTRRSRSSARILRDQNRRKTSSSRRGLTRPAVSPRAGDARPISRADAGRAHSSRLAATRTGNRERDASLAPAARRGIFARAVFALAGRNSPVLRRGAFARGRSSIRLRAIVDGRAGAKSTMVASDFRWLE